MTDSGNFVIENSIYDQFLNKLNSVIDFLLEILGYI